MLFWSSNTRRQASCADLEDAHLRQRLHLKFEPNLCAFFDIRGLRRLGLETVLGDAHIDRADGLDPNLTALRAPPVFLVVQENFDIVLTVETISVPIFKSDLRNAVSIGAGPKLSFMLR